MDFCTYSQFFNSPVQTLETVLTQDIGGWYVATKSSFLAVLEFPWQGNQTNLQFPDTCYRLYVGIKEAGSFQHSSFLRGARIAAAGLIRIKDGQLRSLSPLRYFASCFLHSTLGFEIECQAGWPHIVATTVHRPRFFRLSFMPSSIKAWISPICLSVSRMRYWSVWKVTRKRRKPQKACKRKYIQGRRSLSEWRRIQDRHV